MDKKKQQIIIIGSLSGIILAVLIGVLLTRGGGDSDTPDQTTTKQTDARPQPPPRPTPQAQPDSGTAQPAQTASAGDAAKNLRAAPLKDRRKDPFYYERRIVIPPPNVFDKGIEPIRMARTSVPPPPPPGGTIRIVSNKRVSGLMSGDGVYAILESPNGDVEIVKPGSITKDQYTVVAINPDSVQLEKEDPRTHVTYTQTVLFSDTPVSSTPQGPGGGNGGGGTGRGRGGRGGPGGGPPGGPPPGGNITE